MTEVELCAQRRETTLDSRPLPFLDYFPVGLKDDLGDDGEGFATPVRESSNQLVKRSDGFIESLCLEFLFPSHGSSFAG
jgi:hypothetical protein